MTSPPTSAPRAIALLSGGLDSQLAIRLMQEQGIDVVALHYESPLCWSEEGECAGAARRAAEALGVPLVIANTWDRILEAVDDPVYGHGKGINPCIDCRIIHFRLARRLMIEHDADFIVSGEVLGQRPMSQHKRALHIIEREAGVEGLILRPLSALRLEPTTQEKEGLVERGRLLGLVGRGRRGQMELAKELGVREYPSPAGGCLLTEPAFGERFRAFRSYLRGHDMGPVDVRRGMLLTVGRHFLSSAGEWIVVARDDRENDRLLELDDVLRIRGWASDARGPVGGVVLPGWRPDARTLAEAADLVARYGQGRDRDIVPVRFRAVGRDLEWAEEGVPARGYELADTLARF